MKRLGLDKRTNFLLEDQQMKVLGGSSELHIAAAARVETTPRTAVINMDVVAEMEVGVVVVQAGKDD